MQNSRIQTVPIRRISTRQQPMRTQAEPLAPRFDLQGFVQGVQCVAGGVIAVAQGFELIDRACPGMCVPDRDPQLLR